MLAMSRASADVVNRATREAEGMTGSMADAFATLRAAAAGGAPPPPRPEQQGQRRQSGGNEESGQVDQPGLEEQRRATAAQQV